MKIIGVMPVRNEAWILERTLKALCRVCDAVIVADQRSTDRTPELLRAFDKVQVIRNEEKLHSNTVRWRLLDAARQYEGDNFILALDADEMLAATVLQPGNVERLTSAPAGAAVALPWVQMWRSVRRYRDDDSVWSNAWRQVAFRDDRRMDYERQFVINDHTSRVPRVASEVRLGQFPVLHFQFAAWERMLSKQRWYRMSELVGRDYLPEYINAKYAATSDERDLRTSEAPAEWLKGWEQAGVDMTEFTPEELYWYDVEALAVFAQYGAPRFAELDIWDADWERKRRLAVAAGHPNLPAEPIRDPRTTEQKLYHRWLHRRFTTPPWRRMDWLAPARNAAKGLGLRREHLERWRLLRRREGGGP
jgi:hypothetical protein